MASKYFKDGELAKKLNREIEKLVLAYICENQ
jgi:hypothetical protein